MPSNKQTLSEQDLHEVLRGMPEWGFEEGKLVRFYTFAEFVQAMAFVNQVAQLAEQAGHHPDIDIRYNTVKLALVSHDAGGITALDAQMAQQLNALPPSSCP